MTTTKWPPGPKCVINVHIGLEEGDVVTCLKPAIPDEDVQEGEPRFICPEHLERWKAGMWDTFKPLDLPYDEPPYDPKINLPIR